MADKAAKAERKVHPLIRQGLELGPPILFFVIYMWIKDESYVVLGREYSGFIIAAVAFIPILFVAMAVLWLLAGRLSRLQIFTGVAVVFFGGLTVWFNDERFFKMKTTLVFGTFAVLLGIGLARRESWLQWVMGSMLPMRDEGWMILTRRLALVCVLLAVANEIIWRTQSDETWVWIETFAFPAVLFIFLFAQFMALERFFIEPEKEAPSGDGDGTAD